MLQILDRLQAKLQEKRDSQHQENLTVLRNTLRSPLFNQILTLQQSIKQLKEQVSVKLLLLVWCYLWASGAWVWMCRRVLTRALSLISSNVVLVSVGPFFPSVVSAEALLKREVVLQPRGHGATCFERDAAQAGLCWKRTSAKDISSSVWSPEQCWNWDPLFFTEAKCCLSAHWQHFSLPKRQHHLVPSNFYKNA